MIEDFSLKVNGLLLSKEESEALGFAVEKLQRQAPYNTHVRIEINGSDSSEVQGEMFLTSPLMNFQVSDRSGECMILIQNLLRQGLLNLSEWKSHRFENKLSHLEPPIQSAQG